MFRHAIQQSTNNLRQRAANQFQQRAVNQFQQQRLTSSRRFTSSATVGELENSTTEQKVLNEKTPESVVNELEAALDKVNANLFAEKPAIPTSAAAQANSVVDESALNKAIANEIKQEIQPSQQLNQPFEKLPSFIQHQLADANATGGNRRFVMQEFRTGHDGKGFTTTYRGSFSPQKGLELTHTDAHHDSTMTRPQITTRVYKSSPEDPAALPKLVEYKAPQEQPQLTAPSAHNPDKALQRFEDDTIHSEIENVFSEFDRHPFFKRHRNGDLFEDFFADDFFRGGSRKQVQRMKELERLRRENRLLAAQNEKLAAAKSGQNKFAPQKEHDQHYEDQFDFLDDLFGTPVSRLFFGRGHGHGRKPQQEQQQIQNELKAKAHQPAAAEAEQKLVQQQQQHIHQQQPAPTQTNVQNEALQQTAAVAQPQAPAPVSQAPVPQQPQQQLARNHPRSYYDPSEANFGQWAHALHNDMQHFNNRIQQLEQWSRQFNNQHRPPLRRSRNNSVDEDDFFASFQAPFLSPFGHGPMFHGFGGAPRGFFF